MGEVTFVLSLLLSDVSLPGSLVLGVRRPSLQSDRHPGVLSTPTQRLPPVLFAACQAEWPAPSASEPQIVELSGADTVTIGGPGTARHPLSYAVEAMLCRKLGLAVALADGRTRGGASLAAVSAAVVADPKGSGHPEPTVMLTVRVHLENLLVELPANSAFFDPVVVTEVAEFLQAVACNDALLAAPSLDPFEVCIGGLCVATGAALLDL